MRNADTRNPVQIVTKNEKMLEVVSRLGKIAASDRTVLLIGETGVGKEIISDFIHHNSDRAGNGFVKIGLSNIPSELLESELFGHEKGAFTSAADERKGLFELADHGSIFLDDIDDVPLHIQTKLLRVLESQEIMRIGGSRTISIDVRLIAATKVDLKTLVDQHRFRADLYYRINVVPIEIPPLRERRDDIPLLAEHLITRYSPDKRISFTEAAMVAMLNYRWPGNIRELRNIIQRLSLFVEHMVSVEDLPAEIRIESDSNHTIPHCEHCLVEKSMTMDEVVVCLETNLMNKALADSEGNISQASKLLQMHPSTFRDKMKKYRLSADDQHT
ncbi:MAG: sigma-54 dependent transcriptional regulator [Bacteroidota bacterium]|jgi:DNA-binding NtrC family response regulator